MVISRNYNAEKSPMWGAWYTSWILMHSNITVACSLFPSPPNPSFILFHICPSIPPFSALSYHSTITHHPSFYPCICFFFSLKNSNDGRAFTVSISFRTNMWHSVVPVETFDGSALHSGLSELPALEHSGMLHYTIGQGTRKWVYEIQKKMKIKRRGGGGWQRRRGCQ